MRLLLETNVLSEVTKPRPEGRVLPWLAGLDEDRSCISVVSIAEIRRGVALMDNRRNRDALIDWFVRDLHSVSRTASFLWTNMSPWPGETSWVKQSGAVEACHLWTA